MFLLDTNVVSEMRKRRNCDPRVWAWARTMPTKATYVSVITVMELDIGVLRLQQRDPLQADLIRDWVEQHFLPDFHGRILPIATDTARICAKLHVPPPRPERDALIAASAIEQSMTIVTRNVADFAPMGVKVFNPWE